VDSGSASQAKVSSLTAYRAFLNSGLIVFAASTVVNAGGFVFHAIASRRLGVEDYGALYALISLATMAAVPISLFSPVIVKYAAEFRALHDDGHVRGLVALVMRVFGLLGVLYVAAGFVFAPSIGQFLHVSPWEVPLIGLVAAVIVVSLALRGIGTGIQSYGAYAGSLCMEGVGKVAILFAFAFTGLTIGRGVAAFSCGLLAGLLAMAIPLMARYRGVQTLPIHLDYRRMLATAGGAAALTLTMAVMGFADVVIVKHFFDPTSAGLYSAASLAGKIMLYFVAFVPTVLIPQATHRFAQGQRTRETLWAGVAFIVVVSAVGIAAYRFWGMLLLHLLVGRAFDAAAPFLPGYACAMALLALTNALASYGIATHRLRFATPLIVATMATLGSIAVFHPALSVVVAELVIGNAAMAFLVGAALAWQGRDSWVRSR
jgi:O-antigen/teichoic acid export membrane protein